MKDFLSVIVESKKGEVAAARKQVPEKELQGLLPGREERRSFLNALETPGPSGVNIIAEIKRASPSKGAICPDLDPGTLAKAYEEGGAAALSVLTDGPHFQGSADDLKKARAATALPVLRKDFLISAYQIYEAAAMGADAVLLIARILSRQQLRDLLHLAHELHMDALVEIHSEEDYAAAHNAKARLIGINNRNLATFDTDIRTAMHLAGLLQAGEIPVAASGIGSREDIVSATAAGIRNFLIGESLVRARDAAAFLRELRGEVKPSA